MVRETLSQLILPLSVGRGIEALDELEVARSEACKGAITKGVVLVLRRLGVVAHLGTLEDALAEVVHSERTLLARLQLDD